MAMKSMGRSSQSVSRLIWSQSILVRGRDHLLSSPPMNAFLLRTPRLGFRYWTSDDLPLARSLWSDPAVTKLMASEPWSNQKVQDRLNTEINNAEIHGVQYWPIFLLTDGSFVGACGLKPYKPEERIFEMGYHLVPSAWGKGMASEAAGAVVKYAFQTLNLAAIFAGHHPDNAPSGRVLEKLGFRRIGEKRFEGTGLMHVTYQLTVEEYRTRHGGAS